VGCSVRFGVIEGGNSMNGLELRKGKKTESIRIVFTYHGVLCKETLKLSHTASNIAYAVRKRGEVLNAIARDTFKYHEFFPSSPKAKLFGKVPTKKTIGELLKGQLATALKSQSPSTYRGYKQVCESHLFKKWGDTIVTDLTRADLKEWIGTLSAKKKTILNILTPLRNAIAEAMHDELLESNPFDRIVLDKILSNEQKKSNYGPSFSLAACARQSSLPSNGQRSTSQEKKFGSYRSKSKGLPCKN
jgi:integrase